MRRAPVVALASLSLAFLACSSDPEPAPLAPPAAVRADPGQDDLGSLVYKPSFEADYNRLVPQPWVEPASPAQANDVVVKADRLEFAKTAHPEVLGWAPGRVVVAPPGAAAGTGKNPFGFARRVVSVSDDGTTITVLTVSVGLEDVVTGDFQQVFDPNAAQPVDPSKVDLEWLAANMYLNTDDVVNMPGDELADDDAVLYDDAGNPMPASPFLKKLWRAVKKGTRQAGRELGKAAKTVVEGAKDAWVAVTPSSFTGSVKLDRELGFQRDMPLFDFRVNQVFNEQGNLPVELFVNGRGAVKTGIQFNPGLQVGARIPNIGHNTKLATWLNIDSRVYTNIALDLNLEAGIASAAGKRGGELEGALGDNVDLASRVYGSAKTRLLGSPDMKPAGGWKKTLYVSAPATQTFMAGPVPVVLTGTFQLDLECGFEAKAGIQTKLGFEQNATFKFGVRYEDGNATITEAPKFDYRKRFDVEVTGGGSLMVTCGLIPRVNAFVYDTVGLFAGIRGSLVGRASLKSTCEPDPVKTAPKGEVTLGLFGNVGVQVGARVQAPGSSFAGAAGTKAGIDIGPFELWNTEFPIVTKTFGLPTGLGYCMPTCKNGGTDGAETDVDCGGGQCGQCNLDKKCRRNSDCAVGFCSGGVCSTNSCGDGVRSGQETDVDCGGTCGKCDVGKGCLAGSDCASGFCRRANEVGLGVCVADACSDGVRNAGECGVDCGGSCGKCANGTLCRDDASCASGVSNGVACVSEGCNDRRKNGLESDIDCGGDTSCARCGRGQSCQLDDDCASPLVCDPTTKKCK